MAEQATESRRHATPATLAALAMLAAFGLAACSSKSTTYIPSASSTFIPDAVVKISPTISYTVEEIFLAAGAAAILYVVYDPLAPNWRIEEQRLDDDTYAFSLQAKSFRIGGDGEGMQVLKRRAQYLQRERGYAGYRILSYYEGIDSGTPFTKRVGEGTIQLVREGNPSR